jgi:hypothetical protein
MRSYMQHASEKINYQVVVACDALVSATATIIPSGPTLGTITVTGTMATLSVTGVTAGVRYVLALVCTLASGQILQGECVILGE